jgi:hypothetical protein
MGRAGVLDDEQGVVIRDLLDPVNRPEAEKIYRDDGLLFFL